MDQTLAAIREFLSSLNEALLLYYYSPGVSTILPTALLVNLIPICVAVYRSTIKTQSLAEV